MSRRNEHNLLDQAIAQVTSETLDPQVVETAAARVWDRLSQLDVQPATALTAAAPGHVLSCADLQAMIPAALRGELSPARRLLLEDHTRSCLPCRRALRAAREPQVAEIPRRRTTAASSRHGLAWAIAATLVAALGLSLYFMMGGAGGGQMGRVESIDGALYQVGGANAMALQVGMPIIANAVIRTARSSHAVVRMNDGSLIEMSERAGLALRPGRAGNTIALERGRIIVQAAHQRPKHLYVDSGDCLVSVTGTIFAVNHGTKGTRVSVVEGEVRVQEARADVVLHPGGQTTTQSNLTAVPVRNEVAWSQDAPRYDQMLAALSAVGQDIDRQLPPPTLRTSTHLLDLAPAGTTAYVALPNLSGNLVQSEQLLEQRLSQNPELNTWWSGSFGSPQESDRFHSLIQEIGDLGQTLGDEIAVAVPIQVAGTSFEPVLIAEVNNETSFRATLTQEIQKVNQNAGHQVLLLVGDPATAVSTKGVVLLWVGSGIFVATPSAAELQEVASHAAGGSNPFTTTPFHARVAEAYADGAGLLFAADLHAISGLHRSGADSQMLEALGIYDLEHLVFNERDQVGGGETRAALTFAQPRRGIASWLATPGPMGSLNFFSANANLAVAFVMRSPVSLLDELIAVSPAFASEVAKAESAQHFDLREDLARPLGGEIALGIDGPLLPTPSWKLIVEVEDPTRLQQTITQLVTQINAAAKANGNPGITLTPQVVGGQTFYGLASTTPAFQIEYVFADGYLVAAPSVALLQQALELKGSGATLAASQKFHDLLGQDGQVNLSAVFYRNFDSLSSLGRFLPMAGMMGGPLAGHAGKSPLAAALNTGPSLFFAYAEDRRILFGGRQQAGLLGFNLRTLAGFRSLVNGIDLAREAQGEVER